MSLSIGITGAGNIVESQYLPALKRLGFNDITLYDKDEARAKTLASIHRVKHAGLESLLSTCNTIILTTPPEHHFALLKTIIPHAKRVICEKPFVFREQHAKELSETAAHHKCELLIAHIKRIFPAIQLAKQFVKENNTGKLLRAELFDGSRSGYKSRSGYTTGNPYGGVLLDSGSHAIDSLLYITGLDLQMSSCTVLNIQKDKEEPSHEFSANLMIDDVQVFMKLSRYAALSNKMNLHFEHFMLEIPLDLKPQIRVTDSSKSYVTSPGTGIFNYISEAFGKELSILLSQKDKAEFEAPRFVNLSAILEKLYFHQ